MSNTPPPENNRFPVPHRAPGFLEELAGRPSHSPSRHGPAGQRYPRAFEDLLAERIRQQPGRRRRR